MTVEIDWSLVEDVTDLAKPFKKALAKAEEEDEPALRLQWKEAETEFWQRQAQAAQLSTAKMSALEKYPLAKQFSDEIRGGTPQEVEASAKRFHEKVEAIQGEQAKAKQVAADDDAAKRAQAQHQYGSPVGAGAGTPIPPALEDNAAIQQRVWGKLQQGRGLGDSQSKLDFPRFASSRLREGVIASQQNPRYKDPGKEKRAQDDRR